MSADQGVDTDGLSDSVSSGPAADAGLAPRDPIVIVPVSADFDLSIFQSEDESVVEDERERRTEGDAQTDGDAQPAAERKLEEPSTRNPSDQASSRSPASNAALSIADLLENNVRLDWQEAVAIAQQLCRRIARDPAAKIQRSAIEAWNVEITQTGDVEVLPGGTSSDPLVQQVGRVLRSLLHESTAPAELRLVAAQASFDVPVFSSVEELGRALRRFERPGETEAIRAAFHRGVEAKFSTDSAEPLNRGFGLGHVVSERRPPAAPDSRPRDQRRGHVPWLRIVAVIVGAASLVWVSVRGRPADAARSAVVPAMRLSVSTPVLPGQQPGRVPRSAMTVEIVPPAASRAHVPRPDAVAPSPSSESRRMLPSEDTNRGPVPAEARPTKGLDPLIADEQRGIALLAAGLRDEAAIVFDSIVFRDPLHRLDPASATDEALAVLKRSKQVLLPSLAANEYEVARTAFERGDYARAVAGAERAAALLEEPDLTVPAELRAEVSNLHASAIAARTGLEDRIYTSADTDVSPPRPVGRRLPAVPPAGLNAKTTGRLEILINRAGQVEAVKLYSPLNAYHDRMIVSAAKAWRYRPALRNGKPVRFSLVLSINLPESE
jgi:hypothetical protein